MFIFTIIQNRHINQRVALAQWLVHGSTMCKTSRLCVHPIRICIKSTCFCCLHYSGPRPRVGARSLFHSSSVCFMIMITGEEHALVRDDSYRDVPQIISLWAPDYFVVSPRLFRCAPDYFVVSPLMQLHVTKNTSKNHDKRIQYAIFK